MAFNREEYIRQYSKDKERCRAFCFCLYLPKDNDIAAYLKTKSNVCGFIKDLLRRELGIPERSGNYKTVR